MPLYCDKGGAAKPDARGTEGYRLYHTMKSAITREGTRSFCAHSVWGAEIFTEGPVGGELTVPVDLKETVMTKVSYCSEVKVTFIKPIYLEIEFRRNVQFIWNVFRSFALPDALRKQIFRSAR